MGYGPASYNDESQVKEIFNQLERISFNKLKSEFDGKALNQKNVYPVIWEEPEVADYLFDSLENVKVFYEKASKNNEAIISFVN